MVYDHIEDLIDIDIWTNPKNYISSFKLNSGLKFGEIRTIVRNKLRERVCAERLPSNEHQIALLIPISILGLFFKEIKQFPMGSIIYCRPISNIYDIINVTLLEFCQLLKERNFRFTFFLKDDNQKNKKFSDLYKDCKFVNNFDYEDNSILVLEGRVKAYTIYTMSPLKLHDTVVYSSINNNAKELDHIYLNFSLSYSRYVCVDDCWDTSISYHYGDNILDDIFFAIKHGLSMDSEMLDSAKKELLDGVKIKGLPASSMCQRFCQEIGQGEEDFITLMIDTLNRGKCPKEAYREYVNEIRAGCESPRGIKIEILG